MREKKTAKAILDEYAASRYNKVIKWRRLLIPHCEEYYLSENGDLIRIRSGSSKGSVLKGSKAIRKNKAGKRVNNGGIMDQFYRTGKDGKPERFLIMSRARLMMVTFGDWTLADAKDRTFKLYPKDGNHDNIRIDNLVPYTNAIEGRRATYGIQFPKLKSIDILKIKRSKKSNAELAEEFGITRRHVARVRKHMSVNG